MDQQGRLSLAPAFDISDNPDGDWTATHQMAIHGKRDGFTLDGFKAAAGVAGLKRGRDRKMLEEVFVAVQDWPGIRARCGCGRVAVAQIGAVYRPRF